MKDNKARFSGFNFMKGKPKFSIVALSTFVFIFVAAGIYLIYRMYAASTFDLLDGTIVVSSVKKVERVETSDVVSTSVSLSKKAFPTAPVPTLVIGNSYGPEMLQGTVLAGTLKAPYLIAYPNSLSTGVIAEARRLNPQKVYVVGTPTNLTVNAENAIKNAIPAAQFIRLSAVNKNALAVKIGQTIMKINDPTNTTANGILKDGTIIIANSTSATSYDVAYVAGLKKYPLLFVDSVVPAETRAFVTTYKPTRTIVMGNTAFVSDTVKSAFPGTYRVNGANRYAISANLMYYAKNTLGAFVYSQMGVAPANNNNNVLLASAYMSKLGGPLLVDSVTGSTEVVSAATKAGNSGATKIHAFGGDLSLSSYALMRYANGLGAGYTYNQLTLQKMVTDRVLTCPILTGSVADYSYDTKGYQALSYYQSGQILVNPGHTASLEAIVNHELWHIVDWRDNGRIDWGERVPRGDTATCKI